jgi:hypothetical protein
MQKLLYINLNPHLRTHYKWVTCNRGMAHHQFSDGNGLQMWIPAYTQKAIAESRNKFDFLEHLLSKFEYNIQSASETSFLNIRIKNTTRLSPPPPNTTLVTTNETAARNCLSFSYIVLFLLPWLCRPVLESLRNSYRPLVCRNQKHLQF